MSDTPQKRKNSERVASRLAAATAERATTEAAADAEKDAANAERKQRAEKRWTKPDSRKCL